MNTRGLLFLRAKPFHARRADGSDCWTFWLIERESDRGVVKWNAHWSGEAARRFITEHADALKPGAALELNFERIRAHDNELHATVTLCALAPARWQSREATEPAPAPAPSAPPSFQPQPSAA